MSQQLGCFVHEQCPFGESSDICLLQPLSIHKLLAIPFRGLRLLGVLHEEVIAEIAEKLHQLGQRVSYPSLGGWEPISLQEPLLPPLPFHISVQVLMK